MRVRCAHHRPVSAVTRWRWIAATGLLVLSDASAAVDAAGSEPRFKVDPASGQLALVTGALDPFGALVAAPASPEPAARQLLATPAPEKPSGGKTARASAPSAEATPATAELNPYLLAWTALGAVVSLMRRQFSQPS